MMNMRYCTFSWGKERQSNASGDVDKACTYCNEQTQTDCVTDTYVATQSQFTEYKLQTLGDPVRISGL